MDPITGMLIAAGVGQTMGKIAGHFVDVEDPYTHYQRLVPTIRRTEMPGYLSAEEIRNIASGVTVGTAPVAGAAKAAIAAASPAISAGRTVQAVRRSVTDSLNAVNSALKIRAAEQNLRNTLMRLQAASRQARQAQQFKEGLMDAAASKAIVTHEGQVAKRQAVEDIFGSTVGIGTSLMLNPDFRSWLRGAFGGRGDEGIPGVDILVGPREEYYG